MTRTELFQILKERNQNDWNNFYEIKKQSNSDTIQVIKEDIYIYRRTSIRVYMYGKMLFAGGFSVSIKNFNKLFENLIIEELEQKYAKEFILGFEDYYQTDYRFDITIKTDTDWQEFINEFDKCLKYYEAEVFPKLNEIKFLADYIGVPWENRAEIVVGGNFPVHLFKKIAILKWSDSQELYETYKKETRKLIDLYGAKKPDKLKEVDFFIKGYEKLIHHLENEPNPFEENLN